MSCDDYIPERDNDYPKFDCIDHFITHYQLRDLIDDWLCDKVDTDIDIYDSETEELVYSFRKHLWAIQILISIVSIRVRSIRETEDLMLII